MPDAWNNLSFPCLSVPSSVFLSESKQAKLYAVPQRKNEIWSLCHVSGFTLFQPNRCQNSGHLQLLESISTHVSSVFRSHPSSLVAGHGISVALPMCPCDLGFQGGQGSPAVSTTGSFVHSLMNICHALALCLRATGSRTYVTHQSIAS